MNQTTSRYFRLASRGLQWKCPCRVLPGETGGPQIASAWALPGWSSLLPSALQLEERVKSQKHRVNRNICTHWHTACVFFFLSLQLTDRPAPLYKWTCNDEEGRTDGRGKTKFSLCLSIVIIIIVVITDPASKWRLVSGPGFRGSGVSITHDSWLVVGWRATTQNHPPHNIKWFPANNLACLHIHTYLVHGLHCPALLTSEKKPFLHPTQIFLPLVESAINNIHCSIYIHIYIYVNDTLTQCFIFIWLRCVSPGSISSPCPALQVGILSQNSQLMG